MHAARRRTWDKKSGTKEILYSENKKRLNTTLYSLDAGGFPSNTVFTPHRSGPAQTLTL